MTYPLLFYKVQKSYIVIIIVVIAWINLKVYI